MSPSFDRIAAGTIADGKPVGRGTGCANVRTSGSVGALAGNRQGYPAQRRVGPTQVAHIGLRASVAAASLPTPTTRAVFHDLIRQ